MERIFAGLNNEQRRAVQAVRGPVCILAGAGSGKTTTITHRIAHQVASGAFQPGQILAVTFTDKAAGEMRARLGALGVEGVRARTFHAAALAQLRYLAADPPGQILPSKVMALRRLADRLPRPYRFRPAADLATEIEWARNRRIPPERYERELKGHEPPIPADLMKGIYAGYERGKKERGLVDFEDLLELAVRMFEHDEDARDRFAARYLAFTVDEYQDVNLLQQSLLQLWLGDRDDLCVVGDDYQSIYGFTGAAPTHLLEMPRRYPRCEVVRLESNYRSTPQILDLANRLVPALSGAEKLLRPTRPDGPEPGVRPLPDAGAEARFVGDNIRVLRDSGVAYEDIAVLYRVNYRSEDYEEALTAAGIPFQVRDGAFLARPAARRMLKALERSRAVDVAAKVRSAAARDGWIPDPPDDLGDRELTRQRDLARLVTLADAFDDGHKSAADFVLDLRARFASEGAGRGVQLMTLHRAKGLEFEAVFLPRLQEGELPFKRSRSEAALAEERRLLYVGMTRARRHLFITWTADGKPSRFLAELSAEPGKARPADRTGERTPVSIALREWRKRRSQADGVPAFVVLHDSTLEEIAHRMPRNVGQLALVPGIGPAKLERYGSEILAALGAARS